MKVKFLGASHRQGVSAKNNAPYSISKITYLIEETPKSTSAWDYDCAGYSTRELDLDPLALVQFKNCQLGEEITLKLEPNPEKPQFSVVVGLVS